MEAQDIDNTPSISNQPLAPVQKNNNPALPILYFAIVILVGVSAYLFGVNQGKLQSNSQISNDLAKISLTPINTTIPTDKPTVAAMKKETDLIAVQSEAAGNRNYSLEFNYPNNWSIQKITATHANDKYTKNCVDYTLTNTTTNASVVIDPICGGWSATYYPYPSSSEIVQKMDNQGNDGHTTYWIRYFSSEGNMYAYYDASVSPGESLTSNTKVMDVVLISNTQDTKDEFFIPVKFWLSAQAGTKISESDISISDSIIKSLKLNRM